jgi:hypothetical protein
MDMQRMPAISNTGWPAGRLEVRGCEFMPSA